MEQLSAWVRQHRAGAFALVLVGCFLLNLGGYELFDVDEGAFSEATREMVASGNYLTPHLNGEPRFDKPILIYWLQAASVKLLGVNAWGFRLPSALAAIFWACAVFLFTRHYRDEATGLVAGLITATTLAVLVIGRAATADALLNLWLTLTLFTVFRYYTDGDRGLVRLAFLLMGLGFLTKGPIAVAVPFAVSALFFWLNGRTRDWLRAILDVPGILLFLVLITPWYLMEYLDQGQAFIDGFFLKHNVSRFSDTMEGHGGHLYYYALALPLVLLPYTGLFLHALWRIRALLRNSLEAYLWIWFGVVFVLFSASNTQLPHYILYGCTPLFVLMALQRPALNSRLLGFLPALLWAGLMAGLPWLLGLALTRTSDPFAAEVLTRGTQVMQGNQMAAFGLLSLVIAVLLVWRRWPVVNGLIGVGIAHALAFILVFAPNLATWIQTPVREAALLSAGEQVVLYRARNPSFSIHRQAITPSRRPEPGELFFSRLDKAKLDFPYATLYRTGGYLYGRRLP